MPDPGRAVRVAMLLVATTARGTVLHALGADDQTVRPNLRLQAVRSTTPIVTDGRLDEKAWKRAPVAGSFVQTEPHQGDPATEQTEVRVLYDDEYLYIGVIAFDAEPERIIIDD